MMEEYKPPRYIIDSYAWRDYLRGTGAVDSEFKSIIEFGTIDGNNITPTIVLAELQRIYMRDKLNFGEDLEIIREMSRIDEVIDEETAVLAGKMRQMLANVVKTRKRGISTVDCILLALAKKYEAKVLSGDEHFKKIQYPSHEVSEAIGDLKNHVEYIGGRSRA